MRELPRQALTMWLTVISQRNKIVKFLGTPSLKTLQEGVSAPVGAKRTSNGRSAPLTQ